MSYHQQNRTRNHKLSSDDSIEGCNLRGRRRRPDDEMNDIKRSMRDREVGLEEFAREESRMHRKKNRERETDPRRTKKRGESNGQKTGVTVEPDIPIIEDLPKDLRQAGARSGFTKAELAAAEWGRQMARAEKRIKSSSTRSKEEQMEDPLIAMQAEAFKEYIPPTSADVRNPLMDASNFDKFIEFQKKEYKNEKRKFRKEEAKKKKTRNDQTTSKSDSNSEDLDIIVSKLKELSSDRRVGVLGPLSRPDGQDIIRADREQNDRDNQEYSGSKRAHRSAASCRSSQGTRHRSSSPVSPPPPRSRGPSRIDEFGRMMRPEDEERQDRKAEKERRRQRRRGRLRRRRSISSSESSSSSTSCSISSGFWDHMPYVVREREEADAEGKSIWEEVFGRRRDANEMGFDTRAGAWRSRAGGVYLPPEEEMDDFDDSMMHEKPPDMERVVMRRFFDNNDPDDAPQRKPTTNPSGASTHAKNHQPSQAPQTGDPSKTSFSVRIDDDSDSDSSSFSIRVEED